MSTYLIAISLAAGLSSTALAQDRTGHPETRPWGHEAGAMATPYDPERRDDRGNLYVINGQVIEAPASNISGFGLMSDRRTLSGESLARPRSTAMSIGNLIQINGASNSTFVLTQVNSGQQNANASIAQRPEPETPGEEDEE